MKTFRYRLALVLPLLLVFAQQGAMLHELSHVHRIGDQVRYEGGVLGSKVCETCLAFAQVGNPASSPVAVLPAVVAVHYSAPEPLYSFTGAGAPPPRSRGPPRV